MIKGLVVRLDPEVSSSERLQEIVDAIVAINGTGAIYVWNPLYERMDTPAENVRPRGTIPFLGPGMHATGHFDPVTGEAVVDTWSGDLRPSGASSVRTGE